MHIAQECENATAISRWWGLDKVFFYYFRLNK